MSRSRSAEGEFLGDHRPERRRKTSLFNLLTGLLPADGGHGQARRPRHHARGAVPADARGPRPDVPDLERLPAADARWRTCGSPPRHVGRVDADLAPFRRFREALDRARSALDAGRARREAAAHAGALAHGDKRKLELAMMLARDPRVDAAGRADGRSQRRGRARSSSSVVRSVHAGRGQDGADGRAPHRGRHRRRRPDRGHAPRRAARLRHARASWPTPTVQEAYVGEAL